MQITKIKKFSMVLLLAITSLTHIPHAFANDDNDLDENRYKYKWVVLVNIVQLACIIILIGAVIYFSMNQKVILKLFHLEMEKLS